MDRDLSEITIHRLEDLYHSHKYTVEQVVRWHIARIEKYNGIYHAVEMLDRDAAIAAAAREDAGPDARGPLWGVPIRHQGQHQRQRIGHHRWLEGLLDSGP